MKNNPLYFYLASASQNNFKTLKCENFEIYNCFENFVLQDLHKVVTRRNKLNEILNAILKLVTFWLLTLLPRLLHPPCLWYCLLPCYNGLYLLLVIPRTDLDCRLLVLSMEWHVASFVANVFQAGQTWNGIFEHTQANDHIDVIFVPTAQLRKLLFAYILKGNIKYFLHNRTSSVMKYLELLKQNNTSIWYLIDTNINMTGNLFCAISSNYLFQIKFEKRNTPTYIVSTEHKVFLNKNKQFSLFLVFLHFNININSKPILPYSW